jgi:hypothetical protein
VALVNTALRLSGEGTPVTENAETALDTDAPA